MILLGVVCLFPSNSRNSIKRLCRRCGTLTAKSLNCANSAVPRLLMQSKLNRMRCRNSPPWSNAPLLPAYRLVNGQHCETTLLIAKHRLMCVLLTRRLNLCMRTLTLPQVRLVSLATTFKAPYQGILGEAQDHFLRHQ